MAPTDRIARTELETAIDGLETSPGSATCRAEIDERGFLGPGRDTSDVSSVEEDQIPSETELEALKSAMEAQASLSNVASRRSRINPIYVVLHRPVYPRNIGMCARAMANFGCDRLIIVESQTEITHEAKQGAAHAQRLLREATHYASLADFYASEGEGLRIAFSGKDARLKKSELVEDTLRLISSDPAHPVQSDAFPVYLFFGTESDGLSAEEMALCHHVCRIPTYSEVTSLNLSHAVLLVCFLVRRALENRVSLTTGPNQQENSLSARSIDQPMSYPHATVHRWLELLGFDLSSPRVNIEKTLQRILLAQTPTADELRTLESLLHQTIRKLETLKITQTK